MIHIRIRYFASLRDIVGINEERLTLDESSQIGDVRIYLKERYPALQPILAHCVNAVNHQYVQAETPLHDGDEVVFIPPTGGGRACNRPSC